MGMTSASETRSRRAGLAIATAFFFGIVINLIILGSLVSRASFLVTESFGKYWTLAMAVGSVLAALFALRAPSVKVRQLEGLRKPGLVGSFMYGFVFSLGTSVAPLLLLLTVITTQESFVYAVALAFIFGVGRGIPFLVIGLFSSALLQFTKLNTWRRAIQLLSAAGLFIVGIYYARSFFYLIET
jgi:cytochrome c-type biogenesis protein